MRAMDLSYIAPAGMGSAALLGLATGLAVALPLGAIGVLLLREALAHGGQVAAAGALGVGLVDLVYATAAVFAGAWVVSSLDGRELAVRLVGAGVLVVVAVVGLVQSVRAARPPDGAAAPELASTTTAARSFGRFLGLTAINPLTAVAFVAVAVGLGSQILTAGNRLAFVTGVFVGSLAWQLTLVAIGAFLGARLPRGAQLLLQAAGFVVVLGLAVTLATGAMG